MKVFVFNYRRFDEEQYFIRYSDELGIELGFTEDPPSMDNIDLTKGYDAISIITTKIDSSLMDRLGDNGVKVISTRTIGFDHIDLEYAKSIGMAVAHITYDPNGVAEYTVMAILVAVKRLKEIIARTMKNDFTFEGLLSSKFGNSTVGVIGAGNIGKAVMRDLFGFGCRILYTGRKPNDDAERYGTFVSMEELLGNSDVITLHAELNSETYHMIDSHAFGLMKKGSIIVNTARGPLVDTDALIDALKSGHLGGAFIDVVEKEFGLYYNDCEGTDLSGHPIGILREMPNVVLTHHMAFYYDTAIRDMVRNSLSGILDILNGKENPYRLV